MGIVTALAVFYFIPKELYAPLTGAFIPQHRIAFPLAVLTICGAFMIPWQMALAMMFSCIGDYMGSCGNFIMQMGGESVKLPECACIYKWLLYARRTG